MKSFLSALLLGSVALPLAAQDLPHCGVGNSGACEAVRAREIVDAATPRWRAIGRVNFASIDVRSHCTGTLIADRVVLTAAHCLYNRQRQRWIPAQSIQFVAGYQRGEFAARSAVARYSVDAAQDLGNGRHNPDPRVDWALLVLEDPIGAEVGYLPISTEALGSPPILAGYPGVRPHVLSVAADCGVPMGGVGVIFHRCAAMSGDSGAPLLVQSEAGFAVSAVLSATGVGPDGPLTVSIPSAAWRDALDQVLLTQ